MSEEKKESISAKAASANVLAEALPYISKFHGSYVVVKYGGHALVEESINEAIVKDTILLKYLGMKPVVVHGGGPEITHAMQKFGKKPKFVEGLRITDEETLDIAKMVLVGKINSEIVSKINKLGGRAIGLSGEAGIVIAKKKDPAKVVLRGREREIDLGFVGEVERINPEVITLVSQQGYIPVLSPIGITGEGEGMNINSDDVAGAVASTLKAKKLLMLTDVDGVLKDVKDSSTLIKKLSIGEARELIEKNIAAGSMLPKLKACIAAAESGVEAHIINGKTLHAILLELFTDEGIGTMIQPF